MEITWDDLKRIIADQAIRIYALEQANKNLYDKIVQLQEVNDKEGKLHA